MMDHVCRKKHNYSIDKRKVHDKNKGEVKLKRRSKLNKARESLKMS